MICAIDPGPQFSAYVLYADGAIEAKGKVPNEELIEMLRSDDGVLSFADVLAVEMIASYGMPVGREVFETCVWIGKFIEASGVGVELVYRKDVKLHLCGNPRAKDGNIRQALIDRFGGPAAIGKKATPGVLYGISADIWAALAVAVTYADRAHAPASEAS